MIIINFIGLQIVQCFSLTLFEEGTILHFIWIRWANAANSKEFFDRLLILNKIVKSFLYPVDHVLTCWYWEFKTGITICIVLYPTTLAACFTQHLLNTALNGLLKLTSIGWHFVVPAGIGRISDLLSNNWALTPWVKSAVKASNDSNEFSYPSFTERQKIFQFDAD